MIKIGALWKGKDKKGKTMLSGQFGNGRIFILENNYKEKENQPDFNIFVVESKKKNEVTPSQVADMAKPVAATIEDDDIPF